MLALQVESWQRMVATVVCVEGDITICWGLDCMFALFGKGACTFAHISELQHQKSPKSPKSHFKSCSLEHQGFDQSLQ